MAAKDEFSIPGCTLDWLKNFGVPYTSMQGNVETWWEWYTAKAKWYDRKGFDWQSKRQHSYRLYTLHPARRVCREWASLMFDDGTTISAEQPKANEWLERWANSNRLLVVGKRCTERAFALGTGAIALWFNIPDDAAKPASIRPRRYDARMMVPLDWDDDEVTACAFVSRTHVGGQSLIQAQAHIPNAETGTYHVLTSLWDKSGKQVSADGVIADFDSMQPLPTFAIFRPAIDNCIADSSPFGMSVFDDAIDACKAVDEAFDTCVRELLVSKPKIFMSDDLLDIVDDNGKKIVVPLAPEETVIRTISGSSGDDLLKTFQPNVRSDSLARMLNEAKAQLGDLTGFGTSYFQSEKSGGLKTATEVSSDNSALMRNLANHEAEIGSALERTITAALSCARSLGIADIEEDPGYVFVSWDDSIIEDTPAEKAQMQAEIAAGIASAWEYRVRFYGEDEATARTRAAEASPASQAPSIDAAFTGDALAL